ncbi:hypothetical protein [Flavobacterium subsaxonicum]|uniref:Uncharacterized protein n=1 Tax=Flavobacterium subsaxonicum WB 4.1-42 = DSM 21790 TaxID=1121898 RepID=A0A0A2MSU3_9FLAO|nr:hypothetical protein [Flavobacterium subsaxonicum]KGO94548.1 hypothetical protein Q766_00020 [Flavobacterium subsaxonicum WB 4.1-42 = DSM 21790]
MGNGLQTAIDLAWASGKFIDISKFSANAKGWQDAVQYAYCNGGILLHKYRVDLQEKDNFVLKEPLNAEHFVRNVLMHHDIQEYIERLKIEKSDPSFENAQQISGDLLSQYLIRILVDGGAYRSIVKKKATLIVSKFLQEEYQNRFKDLIIFTYKYLDADWFFDVAWDYSLLIFDTQKSEIMFIDLTDTD